MSENIDILFSFSSGYLSLSIRNPTGSPPEAIVIQ